jgi:hypothetical protein
MQQAGSTASPAPFLPPQDWADALLHAGAVASHWSLLSGTTAALNAALFPLISIESYGCD